jgi:cardiolipin synthase A/B
MSSLLSGWQPWLAAALFLLDVVASLHAILHKRDVRAAISWVGLIWLVPVVGVVLYGLLGLNRIRRQGMELQRERRRIVSRLTESGPELPTDEIQRRVQGIARLTEKLSGRPVLAGNAVQPLLDGDQAYPAMLAAIDSARDRWRCARTSSPTTGPAARSSMRWRAPRTAASRFACCSTTSASGTRFPPCTGR